MSTIQTTKISNDPTLPLDLEARAIVLRDRVLRDRSRRAFDSPRGSFLLGHLVKNV